MTTLPQTTTIRLPRPQGTLQLPGPGGLAPLTGAAATPAGMTGGDIWRVIRSHLWLILSLAVLAGVAGYGLHRFLLGHYPKFTAVGLIEVKPPNYVSTSSGTLMNEGTDSERLRMEKNSQAQLLRQESLIMSVLMSNNGETRNTQWFKSFASPVEAKEDFLSNFTVDPSSNDTLLIVRFTAKDAGEAKTVLQELVDKHLNEQKNVRSDEMSDKTQILNNLKVRLEMHKKDINAAMREKAIRLNIDGGGLGRVGVTEMELADRVRARTELQITLDRAKAQLQQIKDNLAKGIDPPGVESMGSLNEDVRRYKYMLDSYDIELTRMKKTYLPESKQFKDALDTKALYQKKYDDALSEAKLRARNDFVDTLNGQVAALEQNMQLVSTEVDNLKSQLGELTNSMADYVVLAEQERGLREQIRRIEEQLENLNTNNNTRGTSLVSWKQQLSKPVSPTFPVLKTIMIVSIALGLALGLGIAFLRELTDTTVRSPRDIAKVGHLQLLGIVPDEVDDPHASGARLPLVIFDAPHSMTAEKLREIRTRLQHVASLDTTRSIMVSSPGPGDGKTVVAVNLAAGLALNGRRILLVDANFRRPDVHKIFGVGNEQGFSDVLSGGLAFDDVVQETQVPNLSIMTAGPKPINATEMFESQLLIDFIERALEEYDHVVFDSGPVLVVAEAMAMAPRVDGIVSVVRAKNNSRGLLGRMRDALRQVKAEHLGVVLNAVQAQGGGYYRRSIKTYYDYQNT